MLHFTPTPPTTMTTTTTTMRTTLTRRARFDAQTSSIRESHQRRQGQRQRLQLTTHRASLVHRNDAPTHHRFRNTQPVHTKNTLAIYADRRLAKRRHSAPPHMLRRTITHAIARRTAATRAMSSATTSNVWMGYAPVPDTPGANTRRRKTRIGSLCRDNKKS